MENQPIKSNVSKDEIKRMGTLLRQQYGSQAMTIAELMVLQHAKANDPVRAEAWNAVTQFLSGQTLASATIH